MENTRNSLEDSFVCLFCVFLSVTGIKKYWLSGFSGVRCDMQFPWKPVFITHNCQEIAVYTHTHTQYICIYIYTIPAKILWDSSSRMDGELVH